MAIFLKSIYFLWPLQAYNKMSSTEKKALISRFQAQGGLKNLSWAAELKQDAIDSTTVTSNTEKGMFTASQILKFHGLVVGVNITQERQDVVLKELLRENREELGLDPNINIDQVHPTIPELSRYYYEKASSSTSTSNQVQTTLEVGSSSVKTDSLLKPMIAHGDESTSVHENPGYAALLKTMKALQSVKGKVDTELALARSLLLDLEANETEAFLPIQEEIATILKAVDSWLLFCRKALNQGNKANPDTKLEELKELASQLETVKGSGVVHLDGLKGVQKKLKALL